MQTEYDGKALSAATIGLIECSRLYELLKGQASPSLGFFGERREVLIAKMRDLGDGFF